MVANATSDEERADEEYEEEEPVKPQIDADRKPHKTHEHSSRSHHQQRHPPEGRSSDDNEEQSTRQKHKSHSYGDSKKKRSAPDYSEVNGEVERHKSSKHSKEDRHHRSKHETHHNGAEHSDKKHGASSKDGKHADRHKSSGEKTHEASKHKRRHDSEHVSSSAKRRKSDTSPQKNGDKKSSKSKFNHQDDGIEIDHSMGTSFADALGMLEPAPMPKSSSSSTKVASKSTASSTSKSKSIKSKRVDNVKASTSTSTGTPLLLLNKPKLPPLEDIVKDLPPPTECIIPNDYRPSPINPMVMECIFKEPKPATQLSETAALCASTTSKNQRTKVYSGAKSGVLLSVQSLHELCLRFLQKNIDAIEYTGGVPFEILKPVLERASPEQLSLFEHFNPYLMDDSDELWQQHCKRKFRAYKRLEMETWREMFYRCQNEQEDRLNKLTNNIKNSQSIAVPVRQTKLAYVDSMVKPPRSVIKKQNQFGTHHKLAATPAARTEALGAVAKNIARVGDNRLKTLPGMRDTAQAQPSNGAFKPKTAPLMAKVLKMKSRFNR